MDERIRQKRIIRKQRKRLRYLKSSKLVLIIILLAFLIVFLFDKFIISVITVDGDSMQKTLFEGDKIVVQKFGVNENNIKVDDIIYFKGKDDRYYLKRVIAKPGEIVEIVNGKVIVNGVQKLENYSLGDKTLVYSQDKWFIKDGEYFVLGDNREKNSSKDSRIFGTINIDQIKGKVVYSFK